MALLIVLLLITSLDKLVMMDSIELKNKLLLRRSCNRKMKNNLQKKTLIRQLFKKNKNSISLKKKIVSTTVAKLYVTKSFQKVDNN